MAPPIATPARTALLVFMMANAAACQMGGSRTELLDSRTGTTVSVANSVMSYARTESRYSRAARDYVYLAPLETNRQGLREYFLWVGVATTLDRGFLAPTTELPDRLIATLQDEPIEFRLEPWTADVSAYSPPVELTAEFVARVTLDQLDMIARAQPESVLVGSRSGEARTYTRWDPSTPVWRDFDPLGSAPIR